MYRGLCASIALTILVASTALGAPEDHLFGAPPDQAPFLERNGYLIRYDATRRVPAWVAYKITPAYRQVPPRNGRFKSFRTDPDVPLPVTDDDYTGLYGSRGYARGHLAPYAVMGGDRDGDGQFAADDLDDAQTIYEANYMSNIAPQHHAGFNGAPGLWYELERWIQDELVDARGHTVWVIAGTVFGPGPVERVGPNQDISVPPMFFKLVISDQFTPDEPRVLAFLLPHQRVAHGEIQHFLVSIDILEAMTNLDFFQELDDVAEAKIEDADTWTYWEAYFRVAP